jgi:hypothetical protein
MKSRGRITLSNQPSAGKGLNWSLLHTRQCAENMFISQGVTRFQVEKQVLSHGFAGGQNRA